MNEIEIWKAVPNYEGLYEASNFGQVRSLRRGIVLKQKFNKVTGRLYVALSKNGRQPWVQSAHVILTTFSGSKPFPKAECCHFPNKDRTDNRACNLMWGSRATNVEHSKIHGTTRLGKIGPQGIRNAKAKLDDELVRKMRAMRAAGSTLTELMMVFGLGKSATHAIVIGKHWKHVKDEPSIMALFSPSECGTTQQGE